MRRGGRPVAWLGLVGLVLVGAASAGAQALDTGWEIGAFARVVGPMRHGLDGRLPLFLWNLPLSRNTDLVAWRQDGRLRQAIDALAERGIVPTVEMGWEWTPEGAMVWTAKAPGLHESAGLDVPGSGPCGENLIGPKK